MWENYKIKKIIIFIICVYILPCKNFFIISLLFQNLKLYYTDIFSQIKNV